MDSRPEIDTAVGKTLIHIGYCIQAGVELEDIRLDDSKLDTLEITTWLSREIANSVGTEVIEVLVEQRDHGSSQDRILNSHGRILKEVE